MNVTKSTEITIGNFMAFTPIPGIMIAAHSPKKGQETYEKNDVVAELFDTNYGRSPEMNFFGGFTNGINITASVVADVPEEKLQSLVTSLQEQGFHLAAQNGAAAVLAQDGKSDAGAPWRLFYFLTPKGALSATVLLYDMSLEEAKELGRLFASAHVIGEPAPEIDEAALDAACPPITLEDRIASAEAGSDFSQKLLAVSYQDGDAGIEKDPEKAAYWMRKIAEDGDETAMFNLGLYYAKGFGVERDLTQAAEWMDRAAEEGCEDAAEHAEKYHDMADSAEAAENGDAQAQARLARGYMELGASLSDTDPADDYAESIKWAQKAIAQNEPEGMWAMALAYEHGRGVPKDLKKAAEYYQKGADLGHAGCENNLGIACIQGFGVPVDKKKGFALCLDAAKKGSVPGMRSVGTCYQFGHGTEEDMEAAIYWYEKYVEETDDPVYAQKVAAFKHLREMGGFKPAPKKPAAPERPVQPPKPQAPAKKEEPKADKEKLIRQQKIDAMQAKIDEAKAHSEEVRKQLANDPETGRLEKKLKNAHAARETAAAELQAMGLFAFKAKKEKKDELLRLDDTILKLETDKKKAEDESKKRIDAAEKSVADAQNELDRYLMSEKDREKQDLQNVIYSVLRQRGPLTVTGLQDADERLNACSMQLISSTLIKMIAKGDVTKTVEQRKALFSIS